MYNRTITSHHPETSWNRSRNERKAIIVVMCLFRGFGRVPGAEAAVIRSTASVCAEECRVAVRRSVVAQPHQE
jgi:hypothetical protein